MDGASVTSFMKPEALAVDSMGSIFVADSGCHSVRIASFSIAMGAYGGEHSVTIVCELYIILRACVVIVFIVVVPIVSTLAGSISGAYGFMNGQGTSALFTRPLGIIVSTTGSVYVSDAGNCLIRAISTTGKCNA